MGVNDAVALDEKVSVFDHLDYLLRVAVRR